MKKTIAIILTLALALSLSAGLSVFAAPAAEPSWEVTTNTWNRFYANGTPITITTDGAGGAVITWASGSQTFPAAIAAKLVVYGGGGDIPYPTTGSASAPTTAGTATGNDYDSSSVIMESGEVFQIFGGGRKTGVTTTDVKMNGGTAAGIFGGSRGGAVTTANVTMSAGLIYETIYGGGQATSAETPSSTTTANITITGGPVQRKAGAANAAAVYGGCSLCGTVGAANIDISSSPSIEAVHGGGANTKKQGGTDNIADNVTTTATLDITGGTFYQIMGGGMGHSTTTTTTVNFSGTTVTSQIVGSGSNGLTENATVNVSGGTVPNVHAVERGSVKTSAINITGGTVDNAYAGSDSDIKPGDPGASGSGNVSDSATLNITSGATVNNAYLGGGLNGSQDPSQPGVINEPADSIIITGTVPVSTAQNASKPDNTLGDVSTLSVGAGSGLVVPAGGTLTNEGTLENEGTLTNNGSLEVASTGSVANVGTVANNGSVSVADSGSIDNKGTVENAGAITNAGTITGAPISDIGSGSVTTETTGTTSVKERKILSGAGQARTKGATSDIVITANDETPSDFFDTTPPAIHADSDIMLDGVSIKSDTAKVTVAQGSVVLTLKKAHLDTLTAGTHTVRVVYNDGSFTQTTFSINNPASPSASHANPATDFNLWAWLCGLFA